MNRAALALHLVDESQLLRQLAWDLILIGINDIGFPRGAITEIYGAPSSGKATILHKLVATATSAGEYCALIDATDAFDPVTAAEAGCQFNRLLWVRCKGLEAAVKAADLLIHGGGWGVIALDLSGISPAKVRKLPMSWWYRFRRAVENTPSVLVVLEEEPFVKNCAVMAVELPAAGVMWSGAHPDFRVLRGSEVSLRPRKPVQAQRLDGFRARALA
jgi:hypothetical protein